MAFLTPTGFLVFLGRSLSGCFSAISVGSTLEEIVIHGVATLSAWLLV